MYSSSKEVNDLARGFNELTPWDKVEFLRKIRTENVELFYDDCSEEPTDPEYFTMDDVFNKYTLDEILLEVAPYEALDCLNKEDIIDYLLGCDHDVLESTRERIDDILNGKIRE